VYWNDGLKNLRYLEFRRVKAIIGLSFLRWVFDNLGSKDQLLLDNQEAGVVQVSAAVVSATCDGDALL
jgi:hypothetical protein